MAGLGKTKPGFASKGGRKKRNPPVMGTTKERREHEGKDKTQPLPPGPKVIQEREHRGEPATAAERYKAALSKRYEQAKGTGFKASTKDSGGFDPLDAVETALGLNKSSSLRAGGDAARHVVQGELDNLVEQAKKNLSPKGLGGQKSYEAPTKKEAQALATITAFVPATEAAGAGEKALQKVASEASNAETAAKVIAKVKGAPRAAAKAAKEAPVRKAKAIKAAPRKAIATAKRAPELKTAKGQKAAAKAASKTAAKHPLRSGYAGAVVLPEGVLPGDVTKRARAFAEGSASAIVNHPEETLKTTLRALPAAITGPVALGASAVESVAHGTPKPLEEEAKGQAEGIGHIVGTAFSGDPKKAEEAARKEGSLSLLTPIPALTKTRAFKAARGEARGAGGALRRGLATTDKLPMKEKRNLKIRHAPKGVEQEVSGLAARHNQRKRVSVIKARTDNPHRVATAEHTNNLLHALAKAPKGSHVAIQTLAEYGIRNKEGADLIRSRGPEARAKLAGELKKAEEAGSRKKAAAIRRSMERTVGDDELIHALDYADLHPEIFESKAIKEALKHYGKAAEGTAAAQAGKGERARVLPQGDILGIPRPEHTVPLHKRDEFGATSWADAALRLKELRKRQRKALNQAPPWGRSVIEEDLARTQSMLKEAEKGARRKANVRTKKRWATIDGVKKKIEVKDQPYEDRLLKEYVDKVESARKEAGLEKAVFTAHASASGDKGAGLENRFPTPIGRKEYAREGHLAAANELDRSLEGLVRNSIAKPRSRAAGKEFVRNIVDEFAIPFTKDGKQETVGQGSKDWAMLTRRKTKDNPEGGQFDPRSVARLAYREFNNAIDDPFLKDVERDKKLQGIMDDALSGKSPGNEPFVLVPREAIKEAKAQISPEHNILTEAMGQFAKVSNRLILGTNPAWLVAQTVAEGVPMLISHPHLANPAYLAQLYRDSKRYGDRHPELRATAGVSPLNAASLRQPHEEIETYTPETWEKGAEAMTRGKSARSALSFAKLRALGEVDVRRQNAYRKAMYAAEGDRRFRSWHSGLTHLFDDEKAIAKKFRGKSRAELWDWLNTKEGKPYRERIEDHVDAVQGNWTAFTRYERALAPFTIFYPFIRYSLRWALWAFPKEHPVRATILALMGQANSNQLEKLVGGPLGNPVAYAFPAYQNAAGETDVLPGGARISPGQSSITQAIASGNPAAVLSSANPFLGAAITATTGVEPFTGEEASIPRGEAAINALLALPAPVRIAGVKLGGQSPASKAFEAFDPNKPERSLLNPFIPQSGENFKGAEDLSKEFATKYGEGDIPGPFDAKIVQELLYGNGGKPKPELLPDVLQKIHEAEAASGGVKKAEAPFLPPSSDFTDLQKELLEAVENAWKTGPNAQTEETGGRFEQAAARSSGDTKGRFEAAAEGMGGGYTGRFAEAAGKYGG